MIHSSAVLPRREQDSVLVCDSAAKLKFFIRWLPTVTGADTGSPALEGKGNSMAEES